MILFVLTTILFAVLLLQDKISNRGSIPVENDYDIPGMLEYIEYLESVVIENRLDVNLY